MSPSLIFAIDPPSAASGVTWIAAGHLAGRSGQSSVGDQRDAPPPILQHAEQAA